MPDLRILKLQNERYQAEMNVKKLVEQLQTPVDPDVEEGDPSLSERDVTVALLSNIRQHIEAIDNALLQSQAGQYGVCEDCQEAINPERLNIFPHTTLCVACKAKQEQGRYQWAA